ncbi:MerR family transcriptional regulator [Serpentinicella sp. ANB-PHB4]|uniref:TIGR03826 family flagellar region protein n=1 Tax=Serpentinicella sp. ANB-PHB4 TaxID=3074076 RepID=UPI00285B2F2D|nr:TIGR03826 family flagellar region protein [Serpentinicella sp. ANB-PHB4]MDR5659768.1 MerR family transcriptional regulator [Serpentinicella sp. ANB-PHB4]
MDLRNCSKCGRVFSYKGSTVCSRCASTYEDDYKKVKDYLYDNPGASISEVSEETEVPEKQILKYLREARIEIREDSNYLLDCERCGTGIKSGRYCDKCAGEMRREFGAAIKPKTESKKEESKKTNTKMHVADMRKKR